MYITNLLKDLLKPYSEQLNQALKTESFDEAFYCLFFARKEHDVQKILAPILRELTINHLRSNDPLKQYVSDFRERYEYLYMANVFQRNCEQYLDYQSLDGVWATEVEAGALADLLDITVAVTPVTNGKPSKTSLLPRKSQNPDAPVIHLYNSNNIHWYIDKGKADETLGDGNCLYNAYAQYLSRIVISEKIDYQAKIKAAKPDASSDKKLKEDITIDSTNKQRNQSPIVITEAVKSIYEDQENILAAIQDRKPESMVEILNRVQSVITESELPDHAYARNLASQQLIKKQKTPGERRESHEFSTISLDGEDKVDIETEVKNNTPSIQANFFFKVMSHPYTKVAGAIFLIAGLAALAVGTCGLAGVAIAGVSGIIAAVTLGLGTAGIIGGAGLLSVGLFAPKTTSMKLNNEAQPSTAKSVLHKEN